MATGAMDGLLHKRVEMCYTVPMKRTVCLLTILLALLLPAGCHRTPGPAPADTASPGGDAVSLLPLPSETPLPLAPPTPTPDPLLAGDGVYTIGWLSDTQHYSRRYPAIFLEQTRFLAQNAERLNLVYVAHTGDLVHNRDEEAQWRAADEAMRALGAIPYGVLPGNHDVSDEDHSAYSHWFGAARMEGEPWYGGSYEDNCGHFDLIDAGNTKYLFVYLGYNMDESGIRFVNKTLAAHPDRVGVLLVHSYFDSDCTLTDQGQLLYDSVVLRNPNLYMVLCGHRYNSRCIPAAVDDDGDGAADRTVLQMICNYQAAGFVGGDGYLRLMQVDEAAGEIRFYNYSPLHDDFVYYDTEEHRSENHAFDPDGEQGVVPIPWMAAGS